MDEGHFKEERDATLLSDSGRVVGPVKVLGWRRSYFDRRWLLVQVETETGPALLWKREALVAMRA